jgi:fatty-acid desaturase
MPCLPTDRMHVDEETSATMGIVRWAPARSIWLGSMTLLGIGLAPFFVTPGAVLLYFVTSGVTLCFGHSIGLHRLLIHRNFATSRPMEYLMVYLGTLVGMAGPLGMVRLHDTRDWAQRQAACHDLHAHRTTMPHNAWWQMHCRLDLDHPPRFVPGPHLQDRFLSFLEATWMAQQLPLALLFWSIGGLPWLIWGVPLRVAVSVTGHWLVGHITHRRGPAGWVVDGTAVQGHDLPIAALITFGEAWHGNHHAWPDSARLGIEPGQHDPGWWVLVTLRWLGLAWDLREPEHLVPRAGLRRVAPRVSRPVHA